MLQPSQTYQQPNRRLALVSRHLLPAATSVKSGGVTFYTLDEVGAPDPNGGLRITFAPGAPALFSEALKNLCDVKKVEYIRAIHPFGDRKAQDGLYQLTSQYSLPTMIYNDEPPRSALIEQIRLTEKLGAANSPKLIPDNVNDRIMMFGLLNELAGEGGIVYTSRLMGKNKDGSPGMLAVKYGYTPEAAAAGEKLVADSLNALNQQLEAQKAKGSKYFVGDSLSVLDIYWATLSCMFGAPGEDIMPRTKQNRGLLQGFNSPKAPLVEAALSPLLMEHRDFIYRTYLVIPAVLGGTPL